MKRDRTASAARSGGRSDGGAGKGVANPARGPYESNTLRRRAPSKPALALARARTWTHTLVLTGELNQRSAHALEAEIERHCEKGVTGITLDLRQLTYIDSVGVAVIAFRWRLCTKRGYDFGLIAGSRSIQRAFEDAGLAEDLPFRLDDAEHADVAEPTLVAHNGSRFGSER